MKESVAKRMAKRCYKKHRATVTEYDNGIIALDWNNGTGYYAMRYLFDPEVKTITISGDFGFAVLQAHSWPSDPIGAAERISSINYFMEKVRAGSHKYEYDEDEFRKDLKRWYKDVKECGDELAEALSNNNYDTFEEVVDDLLEHFDCYNGYRYESCRSAENVLYAVDSSYGETLSEAGKSYEGNCYLWMYGLLMAANQLKKVEARRVRKQA